MTQGGGGVPVIAGIGKTEKLYRGFASDERGSAQIRKDLIGNTAE
jgi:hypothetical protein